MWCTLGAQVNTDTHVKELQQRLSVFRQQRSQQRHNFARDSADALLKQEIALVEKATQRRADALLQPDGQQQQQGEAL